MAKKPAYYPEKIRKQFRDEYVSNSPIYMTGLTYGDSTIVGFVYEDDKDYQCVDSYEGFPVEIRVQPNGWGHG